MSQQHYVDFWDLDSKRNKRCRTVVGTEADCLSKAIGDRFADCRHSPQDTTAVLAVCYSLLVVAVPGAMALLLGTGVMNDAALT